MKYPSIHTRLIAILGNPLEHSFSPQMHNRVFDKLNMDYLYLPIEVSEKDLTTVFNGLKRMSVKGCNVTIPHKLNIIELLDEVDSLASAIGAVNTVCINNGRTKGYNTDGVGFLRALEENMDTSIKGKRVFIIGSGGAVRAIAMTLAFHDVEKIFLCNRTIWKAENLAAEINDKIRKCAEVIPKSTEKMAEVLPSVNVLINGTSIGMYPNVDDTPVDKSLLFKDLVVSDIVYNPRMTKLLQSAEEIGCHIVDGLGMLVYQGAESFKLWTGVMPPVEEMFEEIQQK